VPDRSHLQWPFFDDDHRRFHADLSTWAETELADVPEGDVDALTRDLVRRLGRDGWLRACVPSSHGGARACVDVRALCLAREVIAYQSGIADAAFALQGLGSLPITLFGSEEQRATYLPGIVTGERVAAFALSEPDAGSDVAALRTCARAAGDDWVIDGTKTWISNAPIADQFVVFARTGEPGSRGLSAFIVDRDARGLEIGERVNLVAPHSIASVRLVDCRVPRSAVLGEIGRGFAIAMATLDLFRPTVGAAALGFARRALDEAAQRSLERVAFGKPIAEFQLVQEKLARCATEADAAALLIYRAAWAKDLGQPRITKEAAMAKLYATEAAQRAADDAVQLFGGAGVVSGSVAERLYREVRALRIYEGTSEIQQLVIAAAVLDEARAKRASSPSAPG